MTRSAPPQLLQAGRRLSDALRHLAGTGRRTPCQQRSYGDLWFSDDQSEREQAAALCRACPVRQLCRDYRDALDTAPRWRGANMHHPRHAPGVWGGVDYTRTPDVERPLRAS